MNIVAFILLLVEYLPGCLLFLSLVSTLAHVTEEVHGEGGPIWRYFGDIVGLKIPDKLGFIVFNLSLVVVLWFAAQLAYRGMNLFWMGVMLGARLGDSVCSHWLLAIAGKVPNPGIYSTYLYAIEAFLIVLWLLLDPGSQFSAFESVASGGAGLFWGVCLGAGFFVSVLPSLRFIAVIRG